TVMFDGAAFDAARRHLSTKDPRTTPLGEGVVWSFYIDRNNEIAYDRIAGARISYGGRGQITDVQQPRYGQQIADILLPY
ncbi:MAG: flagellar basal body L-ring protein FlgH, partial [Paracoccus sp. (in: a-proteobacteria)]